MTVFKQRIFRFKVARYEPPQPLVPAYLFYRPLQLPVLLYQLPLIPFILGVGVRRMKENL